MVVVSVWFVCPDVADVPEEEECELVVGWFSVVVEEEAIVDCRVIVGKSWFTHKTPIAAEEIRRRRGMSMTLRFDTLGTTQRTKL